MNDRLTELKSKRYRLVTLMEHYADSRNMPAFYKTRQEIAELDKKIREACSEGGGQLEP